MSVRVKLNGKIDSCKLICKNTFRLCLQRLQQLVPPFRFKDQKGKSHTVENLWTIVFEDPAPINDDDKARAEYIEKCVALIALMVLRFRKVAVRCNDVACTNY